MEKGQILEFTIEDMSQEGKGIGKADGFAVFLDGAFGVGGRFYVAHIRRVLPVNSSCIIPCLRRTYLFCLNLSVSISLSAT